MNKKQKKLIQDILAWYVQNGRDLPWRRTSDPYRVLVSEIMLQQTQVSRVLEKYVEFLGAFPTLQDLATASTADVITTWKGLGYNRRALFLQKTAQAVVGEYNGMFPRDIDSLKSLPGIGDYTARAVLSFAFDVSVPMMDTNHRKFYNRLFFDTVKKDSELLEKAEEVIAFVLSLGGQEQGILRLRSALLRMTSEQRSNAWHWNQALMDFMSAVNRKDQDEFVQAFVKKYPAIESPKKAKKKVIPFKQTNRYIRGRIIDRLRVDSKVSKRAMQSQLKEFEKERVNMNIENLKNEGLIVIEKRSIMLPRN